MAPNTKKLSREELLQKKRETERLRYQRKKNSQKREEIREKEKLKYQKKKEKGLRKLVKNMTPREHRAALKKWKEYCTVHRAKRLRLKIDTNNFARENTPLSDPEVDPSLRPSTLVPVQISPIPKPSVSSPSLQQGKKEATNRRKNFNRERNELIACLEKKLEIYKKRLARFEGKNKKNVVDTPNQNSCYNTGNYVHVKFPAKNVEYRYAAVKNDIDDID